MSINSLMRLKKIELVGFKSFREKIMISFDESKSVIVGPNGCGKSNVVDAVKWCTGTLSNKNIRTDELLDVIFKGAEHFPASGFASVSLTFNNEGKILPLPYPEIVITRKVYKNLDSVFYINNSSCRLKDIRDLLHNTGLAENGYAIIEQGKVDRLINSSIYERRTMFDEVSGIAKYKQKKREAASKLDKIDADVSSINEIMKEVSRTTHSLRIQAGRARRFKELEEQYNNQKRLLYAKEHKQLNETDQKLQQDKENLYREIKRMENSSSETTSREKTLNEEKEQIVQKIKQLEDQSRSYENKSEFITNEIKKLEKEHEELNQSKNRIEQYLEEIEKGMKDSYKESRTLKNNSEELSFRVDELKRSKESTEQNLGEFNRNLEELTNKIKANREEKATLENQTLRISNEMKQLNIETEMINKQLTEKQAESEETKGRIDTNKNTFGNLNSEKGIAEQQISEFSTNVQDIEKEKGTLKQQLESLNKDITTAKIEIKSLELKKEGISLIQEGEQLNSLDHSNDVKITRIKDAISAKSDYIEVVTSFITRFGDYHIVKTINEAIQLIKKDNKEVNFVFRTENTTRNATPSYTTLNEAVEINQELDPELVEPLKSFLSGFVIINELIEYKGALNNRPGLSVITKKGELISSNTISSAMYSISEIDKITSGLNLELKKKEEESKALAERLESIKEKLRGLNNSIEERKTKREVAISKIKDIEITNNELESKLTLLTNEIESLTSRLKELDTQKETITSEQLLIETRLSEIDSEISKRASDIDALQSPINELETQTQTINNQIITGEQELQKLGHSLDRIAGILKERDTHLKRLNTELEEYMEKIDNSDETRASKMLLIETLTKEGEKINIELDSFTKYMENLEDEIKQIKDGRENHHKQISLRKQQFHDKELESKVVETKIEENRKRIAEDLNIDPQVLLEVEIPEDTPDLPALKKETEELSGKLRHFGAVNMIALEKLDEAENRLKFLEQQKKDLEESKVKLIEFIQDINKKCVKTFNEVIKNVQENFSEIFRKIFNGGQTKIMIVKEEDKDELDYGIEISVSLPGKKMTKLSLMSGGEKALTSIALTLALFKVKKSGVCILDEVDAPLDENNISRFCRLITELSNDIQFIVISHNKRTMQIADKLFGVTMQPKGISKVIEVDMTTKKDSEIDALIDSNNVERRS